MLLSSSSFSNFLDHLSNNPQGLSQQQAQQLAVKAEPQQQQQQQSQQPPKDANPYAASQSQQQQQIGMAMIPEQTMDFSMLNLSNIDTYQPRVFAVTETPEVPTTINADILSGKTSNFVGQALESDDEKLELPALDSPKTLAPEVSAKAPETVEVFDDDFENDPEFALYHSSPVSDAELSPSVDIFGGLEPEKVLARYQLVDASQAEGEALAAMAKVQRISAALEHVHERLERLCL